jgi:hypothetical protein
MGLRHSVAAVLLFASLPLRAGEVLDRLVATVNGHAILQSDWNDELRYESFTSGRAQSELTAEDRRAAFERLIDQELLREQVVSTEFKPASDEQIADQVKALKEQYSKEHNGRPWAEALLSAGLTEGDVAAHVAAELNSLRQLDARFRPSIQIDGSAIQGYYRNELLPKLPAGQQIPLQEATPKIREILIQKKMNELLTSWLDSLRSQAQIRIVGADASAAAPEPQVRP